LHQMDGFNEGLIVPKLGAFNCNKWMGLMKVWLCQIGCLEWRV
jgi:hypothetical protein